jgi:polar amino acid transport system substrate-binding protein
MSDKARAELAPTGVLRAGINLSNFLLVTGRSATAEPEGVAPDVARAIATSLGVPIHYVTFKSPGELADQAGKNVWDIGLIGAEPQRAAVMTFSAAYVEIEATYMVPPGSPITSIDQVDKKGVKVVTSARSAYGLWLENNIKNAELIQIAGLDGAFNKFRDDKIDVLAGLRPGLLKDIEKMPGATILPGKFSAVQQAVGCNKPAAEGARYIAEFVENAKKSGLVANLIEKHKVKGLSVAPPPNR